ncbi:hypothetical protein Patl1_13422 [Pistacia atlantica]|uniref:Uncharacterized protein n=1 Tax=Pistacia atlantica TaxID=434234 RepID=A0ACC1AUK0_9ROSI|nr:hypothetical protein Patl1_13422 [Pistacia atlantica]
MEKVKKHAPSPCKGLQQTEELYRCVPARTEPEPVKEIRDVTVGYPMAMMSTAPDAGQLIAILLKLVNPKKTIEIGVFTGYSLLYTSLNIPDEAKIENEGKFDYAYVDADKANYWNYHEKLMKLLKVGGVHAEGRNSCNGGRGGSQVTKSREKNNLRIQQITGG